MMSQVSKFEDSSRTQKILKILKIQKLINYTLGIIIWQKIVF